MRDGTYDSSLRIAIVGLAAQLPGASTMEAFWRNLDEGVESISSFRRGVARVGTRSRPDRTAELRPLPGRSCRILRNSTPRSSACSARGGSARSAAAAAPRVRVGGARGRGRRREDRVAVVRRLRRRRDESDYVCSICAGPRLFESSGGFQLLLGTRKTSGDARVLQARSCAARAWPVQTRAPRRSSPCTWPARPALHANATWRSPAAAPRSPSSGDGYLHEPG